MCRTYGWPHTQTCILSHSSMSLQTDLTISYNSLVNTNTPTGIKQIRTVYWSALLPRNENFRLVQSSLKQLTTFFLNSQKQIFSKEHNFQEERNMQTFWELLVQTVPLKQVRTKHLENPKFSFFFAWIGRYTPVFKYRTSEQQLFWNGKFKYEQITSWGKKIKESKSRIHH